jgi:hypothetical protein
MGEEHAGHAVSVCTNMGALEGLPTVAVVGEEGLMLTLSGRHLSGLLHEAASVNQSAKTPQMIKIYTYHS